MPFTAWDDAVTGAELNGEVANLEDRLAFDHRPRSR